jgi:CHAD domain-containing protein
MPYRLGRDEAILTGLRRVVREELDAAIRGVKGTPANESEKDGVHEARKAIKKIRAVIRLLAPHLGAAGIRDNIALRDAAQGLSQMRDAAAAVETVEALLARFPAGLAAEALSSLRSELMTANPVAASPEDTRAAALARQETQRARAPSC